MKLFYGILLSTVFSQYEIVSSTKIPTNVLELNDKFLDVMNEGFWLIEFYAPWCAHCKRLQPVWEQVGHALADRNSKIKVGKVDCTQFTSVASQLNIRGFPTIIFFRQGTRIPYEGERKREEIIQFAEKSAGPVINELENTTQFIEMRKNSDKESFFLYAHADGRSESSSRLFDEFRNISESFFTELRFFETTSPLVPFQEVRAKDSVFVIKDNGYEEYDQSNGESLLQWVSRERWPLLPRVIGSNINRIAESTNKKLVLAVIELVDRLNESTATGSFFKIIKETAMEAYKDPEMNNNFQFGWMTDTSMANSIVMRELEVPNLFVFNLSSYEFYLSNDSPEQMTKPSLLLFLNDIAQESILAQGGRAWITRLRRMFYDITSNVYDMFYHQPILTMCLFGVPVAFLSIITYSICSADFSVDREEIYPEDESGDDDFSDMIRERDDSDHEKAE